MDSLFKRIASIWKQSQHNLLHNLCPGRSGDNSKTKEVWHGSSSHFLSITNWNMAINGEMSLFDNEEWIHWIGVLHKDVAHVFFMLWQCHMWWWERHFSWNVYSLQLNVRSQRSNGQGKNSMWKEINLGLSQIWPTHASNGIVKQKWRCFPTCLYVFLLPTMTM